MLKIRDMERLSFDYKLKNTAFYLAKTLEKYINGANNVVFVFVGSDCNVGDSLGPLCGSLIKNSGGKSFLYGSLNAPITAKEVPFVADFVKKMHPASVIVVVDAAVGKNEDFGLIKVQNEGIKPGLGVDKDLPLMGDVSIIGVLGEKMAKSDGTFKKTRVSTVYLMAEIIAEGIDLFVKNNEKRLNFYKRKNFSL